jgi:hypothetical protein
MMPNWQLVTIKFTTIIAIGQSYFKSLSCVVCVYVLIGGAVDIKYF